MLQQIKLFKHEDIPLSLGLVIDNSGSMRNKRERVNSAALLSFARAIRKTKHSSSTSTIPPISSRTSRAASAT